VDDGGVSRHCTLNHVGSGKCLDGKRLGKAPRTGRVDDKDVLRHWKEFGLDVNRFGRGYQKVIYDTMQHGGGHINSAVVVVDLDVLYDECGIYG
jgi:hypothetical protein